MKGEGKEEAKIWKWEGGSEGRYGIVEVEEEIRKGKGRSEDMDRRKVEGYRKGKEKEMWEGGSEDMEIGRKKGRRSLFKTIRMEVS